MTQSGGGRARGGLVPLRKLRADGVFGGSRDTHGSLSRGSQANEANVLKKNLTRNAEFFYFGSHPCKRHIGPERSAAPV